MIVNRQAGCGEDDAGHTQKRTKSQQKQVHSHIPAMTRNAEIAV
jgi:hypothetical protein